MIPELDSFSVFIYFVAIFFAVLIIRYFIAAGVFYWYFYILKFDKWKNKKLNPDKLPDPKQLKIEIKWSVITSSIFAIVCAAAIGLYQAGYTAVYTKITGYGYWYLPLSLLVVLFLHETYYYWVHKWMHHPKIFHHVHKVHHDSIVTSPWTAFSFHPWEGLLEAMILPLLIMIVPMHPYVILTYLVLMTISSVINHLDIELFSYSFQRSRVGRWLIGATHHYYHHKEFKTNYGLYFTFWDKWMGTESKKYQQQVSIKENKNPGHP